MEAIKQLKTFLDSQRHKVGYITNTYSASYFIGIEDAIEYLEYCESTKPTEERLNEEISV